jgi:hypothetical protein
MTLEHIEFSSVWYKEVGAHTADFALLTPEETGMGDLTLVAPTITVIRGRDADANFVELATVDEAPGDTDSFQLDFRAQYDIIHTLEQFRLKNQPFYIQLRSFAAPPVDVASLAKKVEHYRCAITGGTRGAGPNLDASGGLRDSNVTLAATEGVVANLGIGLSRITTADVDDGLSFLIIDRDLRDRTTGYRGPDKVMYLGMDDDTANPGLISVSIDSGATWANITTDPDPFTQVSGIDNMTYQFVSETQFRLLVGRTTDAGTKAQFAYVDMTFGSENVAASWTVITIAATSNADAVEYLLWPQAGRLYIAAAGDVYLSTDLGESDPGTAIFTGSNAIADMFYDSERNVWAVAAANAILVELVNDRGTFTTRTGPTGGGAFTAFARAKDGVIYAGNGTSIFRNINEARTAGGWTSLKDFGANHAVVKIVCVKGSSQIIYAFVSDSTAGQGDVWFTTNGGVTWTQKTATTNSDYNAAAASRIDDNLFFITGPADTGTTLIEKLS